VTVQRLIELRGISTVAITASPDDTAQANPPRALCPTGSRPGHTLLRAGDAQLQKRILLDALDLVVHPVLPGEIVAKSYT
jgi:hypothetical protein